MGASPPSKLPAHAPRYFLYFSASAKAGVVAPDFFLSTMDSLNGKPGHLIFFLGGLHQIEWVGIIDQPLLDRDPVPQSVFPQSRGLGLWGVNGDILSRESIADGHGQRHPKTGLLHHSDQGSRYASGKCQYQLQAAQMVCGMNRKGNGYDHAVVKRVFRSLKDEVFLDQPPETRAYATLGVIDCLAMFDNRQRRHSILSSQSPKAFEAEAAALKQGEPQVRTKPRSAREGQR